MAISLRHEQPDLYEHDATMLIASRPGAVLLAASAVQSRDGKREWPVRFGLGAS